MLKKILNLNTRQNFLAAAAILLVALFLFEKLFLSGLRTKIRAMDQEIKKAETGLAVAMNVQARKEFITEDNKAYDRYFGQGKISDVKLVTDFLKEIEVIAQKTRISIVSLNPDNKPREDGGYKKFYADLRFEASSEQIHQFLNEIQNSGLLIKAEKIAITSRDESAASLRVDATISMAAL